MVENATEIKSEGSGNIFDIKDLSRRVWQRAISQPQGKRLKEVGREEVTLFAEQSLRRMFELEEAAETPLLDRVDRDDTDMDAIWCLSAPGTFNKKWKYDRYAHTPYTQSWDRDRILASISISKAIGRLRLGISKTGKIATDMYSEILDASPPIVYNGRPDENKAIRDAKKSATQKNVFLDEIFLIDTDKGEEYNSLDQVRSFRLPDRDLKEGDSIGVVIHPGQALRLLHFLEKEGNGFPENVRVKIFPLPTGTDGNPHNHILETCGLLYYRFTTGDASDVPYPYIY